MLLELSDGKKMLFDFADVKTDEHGDKRWDIADEFDDYDNFNVVMFTHAHEDHITGSAEFFNMEYSRKNDDGVTIGELWLSSAFVTDTNCSCEDSEVIRQEARERLKAGKAVKIFGHGKALSKWLETAKISEESVNHLIFHAGENISHDLGDEVSFFLHAPFSKDCDDVDDKNDPSVVMQVRLDNAGRETNILITGDTPCDVIDDVVLKTQEKGNEEYLLWDLYDIPHHCSHTGLCKTFDKEIIPTENVQWLLDQSGENAFMVASCKALADADSPPPSEEAEKAYNEYKKSDVTFRITMEYPKSGTPESMIFTIDSRGLTPNSPKSTKFFSTPATRAG
jgi:hypothetical protein